MDNKQLETIAVTALISVIARELFAAFLSMVKTQAVNRVMSVKAARILAKRIIVFTLSIIILLIFMWQLHYDLNESGPITRADVRSIVEGVITVILTSVWVMWTAASVVDAWRQFREYRNTKHSMH